MDEYKQLLEIADRLLGPEGCPWDQEQTIFTLQPFLLEEAYELIEAIDQRDPLKISEELGDVLYTLIFIAKLGEKESLFTLSDALRAVAEKLIRRHPHVFGGVKVASTDEIMANWEVVKKQEGKKSPIDGIPPALPALTRAQKVIAKLRRAKDSFAKEKISEDVVPDHKNFHGRVLGQKLWDLVVEADLEGIDAEGALRRVCLAYEEKFNSERPVKNAGEGLEA